MRLGTFISQDSPRPKVGVQRDDHVLDLGEPSMKEFLARGEAGLERARTRLRDAAGKDLYPLASVRLLPPCRTRRNSSASARTTARTWRSSSAPT
jgi:hypothetical protein